MGFLFASKAKSKKPSNSDRQKAAKSQSPSDEKVGAEIKVGAAAQESGKASGVKPARDLAQPASPPSSESASVEGDIDLAFDKILAPETSSKKRGRDRTLFKSLLASLYDAVLIIDSKGAVIENNPRAEKFFEYNQSELWNMRCSELIAAISQRVLSKIQQHAESGRFTVVNATCRRKDGTTFPAEIAVSKIHMLHEDDLIFAIRNLEKREKGKGGYEMELEAFRFAGAGVAICNLDGLIECVNPAFLRLLQYDQEGDVVDSNIRELCQEAGMADAFLDFGSNDGTWIGRLQMISGKGFKREFIATAVQSGYKDGLHFILTLTPVPRQVIAS